MRHSSLAIAPLLLMLSSLSNACIDLDGGGNGGGGIRQTCSYYNFFGNTLCGNYDDSDFFANTMCCACGGGSSALECACDTISIVLTGSASARQGWKAGEYTMYSASQDGRAVYKQTSGTNYIYRSQNGYWMADDDYTTSSGGLATTSYSTALCPEAVGDSWQYYDGSWVSGGVQVQCAPCACDSINIALSGNAARWSDMAGQYTKTSTMKDGQAVYEQTIGSNYLFFQAADQDWYVWRDYTSSTRAIESTTNRNTHCPEAVGDSWQYWSGTAMESGGVQVQCTGPSPPPLPPPPPGSATFATKAELKAAVQLWDSNKAAALSAHGPIAGWGVSAITDMQSLFSGLTSFNEDISSWDTSSVTDMSYVFLVRTPLARAVPGVQSVPPCTLRAPPPRPPHALAPLSPLCRPPRAPRCHSAGHVGVVRCKQAAHPLRLGGQLGL